MAPKAASAPSVPDEVHRYASQVYEACLPIFKENPRYAFNQMAIQDLDIVPDDSDSAAVLLLSVLNYLVARKLFKVVTDADGVAWRLRTEEDAKHYRTLTIEQDQVYSLIDESGADGIWSRTLKAKTNLHDAVIRSAIKVLETRSLIRDMKSVEHPTRKMYIKASMRPSERATGGSWYTDSELDEEFVAALCKVLFDMIWKRSFYRSSSHHSATRQAKKVVSRQRAPSDAQIRQELEIEEDDESARLRRFNSMLPMPPHYQGYPTLTDLTAFIDGHPITQVTLPESDIQQLMEILVFDDMVEPVPVLGSEDNVAYRATRRGLREVIVGRASAGNGFTTVPCGACPVFDLCEEGGPVCPSGCVYFRDWLVS